LELDLGVYMKYWRGNQIDLNSHRPEEGYLYEYWEDIPVGGLWRARSKYPSVSSLLWQWDSVHGQELKIDNQEIAWAPDENDVLLFMGLIPRGTYASVDSSRMFEVIFFHGEKYWKSRFTFQDIREFYKSFTPLLKVNEDK